ncbi:hexosaminidase D-like [Maniola jurtina]|uniref:hexosaminidase D-like n=1 Tax=Maniola jurtina TaxID=191418 RepID=UPI001E68638F|nr:hexosaminidase D-like [Maniola jurtina]XP_045771791.1 hexosaminidase D-like [Maniola jurtina]
MHKIVHLDLKGAPLKLSFLEQVLKYIKKCGATGILIEWEDSFPYRGEIVDIGSNADASGDGMYSIEEVMYIFQCAKENQLEVIQLVQTIGHMEFVLKHPVFRKLQEKPRTPAVLCPSQQNSQSLVRAMVQQVLNVQPDAKYFHIGADEVWHTAVCIQCQYRAVSSKFGKLCLYLEHIRDLAIFIKQLRPELTILLWDDMLRSTPAEVLQYYKLGELVRPVVWDYNIKPHFHINPQLWENYKTLFPTVWAGSAFKGANGSCKVYTNEERYMSNQEAWIDEVKKNSHKVDFVGVILTGWSRYDHFATLCELLAVSMGCLRECLRLWNKFLDTNYSNEVNEADVTPGQELVQHMQCYEMFRERSEKLIQSDLLATWMNPWQVEHGYTCPAQLEIIANESVMLIRQLTALREIFVRQLAAITGSRSTKEWLGTFITPLLNKLTDIQDVAITRYNLDASVRPI